MNLTGQKVVVTGGSRGLGLGLVEALVAQEAKVTVVARDHANLRAVRSRLGVATVAADVAQSGVAQEVLCDIGPAVVVLNAGATPRMGSLRELTWQDFSATWETDVRAGLYWMQAALTLPMEPGSRVMVLSSGAAQHGSPLSGGYAGAKRTLWLMARYANEVARQDGLGVRFQVLVPRQLVEGTGVGDRGANAYGQKLGITPEAFLARFGAPMAPRQFGEHVVSLLRDDQYADGVAFGLDGRSGITMLEGADP